MMVVSKVNGCGICSYARTKMALGIGVSPKEINSLLSGSIGNIPPDETAGVMFAQNYAGSRGNPSREAWDRVVKIYGLSKAKGIVGSIRIIIVGNVFGIPTNSFINRFRGKPDSRSSLLYEMGIIFS